MTALGSARKALARPTVSSTRAAETITLEELGRILSGASESSTGLTVSEKRALGLAAWWSGTAYLTDSVSFLPTNAFRGVGKNRRPRSLPLWIQLPMRTPSNRPVLTWSQLRELWMMSLLHRGNAYGWKIRDNVGRVVGMNYLHPDRVTPLGQRPDGELWYRVKKGTTGFDETTRFDVFHILGRGSDGIQGMSPIQHHAETLGIAVAADEFAGRYFANGGAVTSFFKLTKGLGRRTIEEVKAELGETHKGIQNAHEIGVLAPGVEYEAPQLNAKDAQILEAREWSVLEIARILRLPPHKLYDLTRATFSNIEQQSIEAVTDGVVPWVERIEDQVSADPDLSLPDTRIELSVDGLMRGDSKNRAAWYGAGIDKGWMELAEVRAAEGMEPKPGMDVVYRPSAMHVIDTQTGEILIPAGAPSGPASDSDDDGGDTALTGENDDDDDGSETDGNGSRATGISPARLAAVIGGTTE
jgi:HK97 family phage portal protein